MSQKDTKAAALTVIAEFKKMVSGIGMTSLVPAQKLARAKKVAADAFAEALGISQSDGPTLPPGTPDNLKWKTDRLPGEEIPDFIVRVYGGAGWLDKGMTLKQLRNRDPSAVGRLYRWIRENDKKWPEVLKGKLPGIRNGHPKIVIRPV